MYAYNNSEFTEIMSVLILLRWGYPRNTLRFLKVVSLKFYVRRHKNVI